jgi:hypothetical protein
MWFDWRPIQALVLWLAGIAAATYFAYRVVARRAPGSPIYRPLVVVVGVIVALRIIQCDLNAVGGGRYEDLAGGWFTAHAEDFARPRFWGGVERWTRFQIRAARRVIYEKTLAHDDFDVDWRSSGDVEQIGDYRVRFRYDAGNLDREFRSLEVVVDYEKSIPPDVKRLMLEHPRVR